MNNSLTSINTSIGSTNSKLDQIYDRLEHVKVDSYVNARIVDSLGELPIPASEAGLLVDFVGGGSGTPFNVNVTNSLLPVGAAGEVPLPVEITNSAIPVENYGGGSLSVVIPSTNPVSIAGTVPVSIASTVPVSIADPVVVHPELLDFYYGTWQPSLGFGVNSATYARNDGNWTGTHSGCAPLSVPSGVDGSASGSTIAIILGEAHLGTTGNDAGIATYSLP